VTSSFVAPAELPPRRLEGIDADWSRLVHVEPTDGVGRTWHLLDNGVDDPRLTLLCVHGNPSWSYLWRKVVAGAPPDIRVVAVDQLDMGFSERSGLVRPLETRIDDLVELTDTLGLDGPVITVAHDWGGPISLGWALRHREQLAGLVLLNTAVHQPEGSPAPALIRMTRTRGLLRRVTVDTSAFIAGAMAMSKPSLPSEVRQGFRAPYRSANRRQAIAHFVEDIPLDASHTSAAALDRITAGMEDLAEIPALLLWGPRDKVFSDLYLHDLERRLPHADVHRFPGAGHFVSEDADVAGALFDWLKPRAQVTPPLVIGRRPLWAALDDHRDSAKPAVIEMTQAAQRVDFGDLKGRVEATAAGLSVAGVMPGDRVALMVPPSVDLTVALYACWRLGATIVLVDAGLGPRGMGGALASAAPDHMIGISRALVAARLLRWPGRRFSVEALPRSQQRLLNVVGDLRTMAGSNAPLPAPPSDHAVAAVAFTSGATGPSKGVVYRHHQVQTQRDTLMDLYDVSPQDRLVAAFAPFALYGPAMGITSVVPDMDVTAPSTLDAAALGAAVMGVDATLVFASPAALVNVVKTAGRLTIEHRRAFENVRLLLSAGAPVRPSLLRAANSLFPNAVAHTPYGMTEVLPVADITLAEIEAATGGDGVCVGHPVPGVEVLVSALDDDGEATGKLSAEVGVMGEVVVRAGHARDGYDRLWHTQHRASQSPGWHRSGDVGHLDESGRLWIGGRTGHVITTAHGPVTPVGMEQLIEELAAVDAAAVVGVGPPGAQQTIAVVETADAVRRPRLGDLGLHTRVRERVTGDIAAVLTVPQLPVDPRHNSKIDRTRVARWAESVLAGGPMRRL